MTNPRLPLAHVLPTCQKSPERNFSRRMDLSSLQLFAVVGKLGGTGKTAEREFIAASAAPASYASMRPG